MKQSIIRLSLILLLFVLVTFSGLYERVPVNDGSGWDGKLYREIATNFDSIMEQGGLSSYYVAKSLPFVTIYAINQVLNISPASRLLFVFLYVSLVLGIVGFYKIVKYKQLSLPAEIVAFALCFYIYPVLKLIGYYPWSGDHFAYPLGIWIYYFFLSGQKNKMLLLSIVGAFVWQSILPISVLLYILPDEPFSVIDGRNVTKIQNRIHWALKILLCIMVCSLPLIRMCFAINREGYSVIPSYLSYNRILSIVGMVVYVIVILKPLNFNIINALNTLWRHIKWKNVVIGILTYVSVNSIIYLLANPLVDSPVSTMEIIKRILFEPFGDKPLKFLECHLIYYGLLLPFLIVFYKEVLSFIGKAGISYLGVFFFTLVMLTQCESRFVINLIPFIVFPIVVYLSSVELKRWIPLCVIFCQLFFSRIWYKINVEGIESALLYDNHLQYELSNLAQRYFVAHGPWQGTRAYCIYASLFIIILFLLIIGRKYNFFTKKHNAS